MVESYVFIGRFIGVDFEQMIEFVSNIEIGKPSKMDLSSLKNDITSIKGIKNLSDIAVALTTMAWRYGILVSQKNQGIDIFFSLQVSQDFRGMVYS